MSEPLAGHAERRGWRGDIIRAGHPGPPGTIGRPGRRPADSEEPVEMQEDPSAHCPAVWPRQGGRSGRGAGWPQGRAVATATSIATLQHSPGAWPSGCKAGGAHRASPGPAFRVGTGRDKAGGHPENNQAARRQAGSQPKPRKPGPAAEGETGQRLQGAGGHLVPRAQWAPGYRGHPTLRASPGRRQLHSPVGQHVAWGPAPGHREKPGSPAEASLQASAALSALGTARLPSLPTELPVLPPAQVSMKFPRPALPLHPLSHPFLPLYQS